MASMKYLINVHLLTGEVRNDIFFNTMEEIEAYVIHLKQELAPFKVVVVYDAETKEAVKMFKP